MRRNSGLEVDSNKDSFATTQRVEVEQVAVAIEVACYRGLGYTRNEQKVDLGDARRSREFAVAHEREVSVLAIRYKMHSE